MIKNITTSLNLTAKERKKDWRRKRKKMRRLEIEKKNRGSSSEPEKKGKESLLKRRMPERGRGNLKRNKERISQLWKSSKDQINLRLRKKRAKKDSKTRFEGNKKMPPKENLKNLQDMLNQKNKNRKGMKREHSKNRKEKKHEKN